MTLDEYIKGGGALSVAELREAIGVKSDAQIRQWQHGYASRLPGPAYCVAIEKATAGAVTRHELRPNDWHLIWPELITAPAHKAQPAIDSVANEPPKEATDA